jgi:hypothetical protein
MNEEDLKRLRHINGATKVNKAHQQAMKEQSIARKKRSQVQKMSELFENRNINYRKHM